MCECISKSSSKPLFLLILFSTNLHQLHLSKLIPFTNYLAISMTAEYKCELPPLNWKQSEPFQGPIRKRPWHYQRATGTLPGRYQVTIRYGALLGGSGKLERELADEEIAESEVVRDPLQAMRGALVGLGLNALPDASLHLQRHALVHQLQ